MAILESRAYVRTKAQVDAAKKQEDVPDGPLAQMVGEFTQERYQRALAERKAVQP
jgi:hypothetical protein